MHYLAPQLADTDAKKFPGLFWFTGDDGDKRAEVISGPAFLFGSDVGPVTVLDPGIVLT